MDNQDYCSTLLFVDDDPSMVRLISKIIEVGCGERIKLESLTDPAKALVRIEQGGIDILLTDLDMPGINGLGLLKCAKRRNACTQVLFLTGHSTQAALLEALELGATDYLLKPLDREQVVELVLLAHERTHRWRKALADTWRQRRKSGEVEKV